MPRTSARSIRHRDPESTREAILEAAERVFVDKGFAEAAVSEIASAAGVTKSLIHHHFGSKEGLWEAVKTRRFSEYARAQKAMIEESGADEELLRRSMEVYFHFLRNNPQFVRFITWVQLEEPLRDTGFEPGEMLTRLGVSKIQEAQANGKLRADIHPYAMMSAFLGLCEHWFQAACMRCHLPAEVVDLDDERYLAEVMKIFFEGILPRTPPATG